MALFKRDKSLRWYSRRHDRRLTTYFQSCLKPTPSIAATQHTVNKSGEDIEISIKGRHDPIIVPRAVVVVEAMAAITIADALLMNMGARMDRISDFYLA